MKGYDSEWLLVEKEKRNITFEYLAVPDFYINEETKEIDQCGFIEAIRTINPQVTIMVICYSQILDLKFLLEGKGLFAEMRVNRDLNILSRGQILTMNEVQKEFIQTLAQEENIEKDVVITGPVGSGKTLLALEAINMKKSHYKTKHCIAPSDCQKKIRVIIWIRTYRVDNLLKQQMLDDMAKSFNDCSLTIHTSWFLNPEKLKAVLQNDKDYKSYTKTLIMFDEIDR